MRSLSIVLLTLATFSSILTPPARASGPWFGNDNGEFDVGSPGFPMYVGMQERFIYAMNWTSSPPNNHVSMQYNPDLATSLAGQYFAQWFQTGIWTDSYGCGGFTIQVYSITSGNLIWRADQSNSPCLFQGYLAKDAVWNIREDMKSSSDRTIVDVAFSMSGAGGKGNTTYVFFLDPASSHWLWERSNLCWCGTDLGSTTYGSAYGLSTVYSDLNVTPVVPPLQTSTREDSNMPYGGFVWPSDLQHMIQQWGWCGTPCGGGGGGGSVARDSLITLANGSKVPVQDVRAGDRVVVYNVPNEYETTATVYQVLTVTVNNNLTISTSAGGAPFVADANPNMKLWVLGQDGPYQKPITTIQRGDQIYNYDIQSWVRVTDVTITYGGLQTMYDLLTNPNFTSDGQILEYIANGYPDCAPRGCKT